MSVYNEDYKLECSKPIFRHRKLDKHDSWNNYSWEINYSYLSKGKWETIKLSITILLKYHYRQFDACDDDSNVIVAARLTQIKEQADYKSRRIGKNIYFKFPVKIYDNNNIDNDNDYRNYSKKDIIYLYVVFGIKNCELLFLDNNIINKSIFNYGLNIRTELTEDLFEERERTDGFEELRLIDIPESDETYAEKTIRLQKLKKIDEKEKKQRRAYDYNEGYNRGYEDGQFDGFKTEYYDNEDFDEGYADGFRKGKYLFDYERNYENDLLSCIERLFSQ